MKLCTTRQRTHSQVHKCSKMICKLFKIVSPLWVKNYNITTVFYTSIYQCNEMSQEICFITFTQALYTTITNPLPPVCSLNPQVL